MSRRWKQSESGQRRAPPSQLIHINDPMTGYYYDLDPSARTAIKGSRRHRTTGKMEMRWRSCKKYDDIAKRVGSCRQTKKAVELMVEVEKRKQEKLQASEATSALKEGAMLMASLRN